MAQQSKQQMQKPKHLVASNSFQPEELVFTFNHVRDAKAAQDEQMKGFESANRYYHITTPIEQNSCVMYRFQLKGYAYGSANPLDLVWCGYTSNNIIQKPVNVDIHKIGVQVSQYIASNKRVCLKFGPINRYCNGFAVYYSAHYCKATQGLDYDKYAIRATAEDGQI
eukprot:330027_1